MPDSLGIGFVWWLDIGEQVINPERSALADPLAATIRAILLEQPGGAEKLKTLQDDLESLRQDRSTFGELVRAQLECMWADRKAVRAAHGRPGGSINKTKADGDYPTYRPVWEAEQAALRSKTNGHRRVGVGEIDAAAAKKLGVDAKTLQRARLQNWREL
jgi:hypothetical protein